MKKRKNGTNGMGIILLLLLFLIPFLINLISALFEYLILIIVLIISLIIVVFIKKYRDYRNGSYYQITKLPYCSVKYDMGKYGEYLIYKHLKKFEKNGAKLLFNIYIPKVNGETTEVDILMISAKGVFVFESKNYGGFIFGDEDRQNWCQTLPMGRRGSHKEYFYNPIMQNRSHIKHLKAFLGEEVPTWSIIVFSDRCTLKSIKIRSNDIDVINLCDVKYSVLDIYNQISTDLLSESEIDDIYNKLYPYTQVDDITKGQHIENIYMSLNSQSTQQVQNKCPQCDGNLVLRTATKGANAGRQFYGCSNYPKCKYIQNIAEETDE